MGSCKDQEKEHVLLRVRVHVQGPIIVGAGPSGLAVAACLSEHKVPFVILERSNCIASLWQNKTYDRLKLHLPKHFCELPLKGFPNTFPKYPSKYQFISYMESYAEHFNIHPKFNQMVQCAEFDKGSKLWVVRTLEFEYVSHWLVVATGENAEPFVPKIPGMGLFRGPIAHTSVYKSGSGYASQRVLVIGCGNSGMEVSLDLCRHHATPYMVARNTVHVLPREMFGFSTFGIAMTLHKWLPLKLVDKILLLATNFILGNTNHYGIKRPKTGPIELKLVTGKTPVLDVGQLAQIKCGNIKVMEGVKEITRHGAKFVNGQEKEFDAIILATGYKSNVPTWLKGCDFFTEDGMPKTPFPNGWKGDDGLYTVGFTRRGLQGTSCDAIKIAEDIAEQWRTVISGIVTGPDI
ncbi:hypothetical protein Fmac_031992 [Flemingia macrophylla]|uniref:indole-3-pyruvate monooxygenase n=1 Tax=Flemingia macrophylla TaxID=520843 RepID=A0ABD1L3N4_9FABA